MSAELERTTVISDVDDDSVENQGNDLNFKLKYGLPNLSLKGKAENKDIPFFLRGKTRSLHLSAAERGEGIFLRLLTHTTQEEKENKKESPNESRSFFSAQKGLCRRLGLVPFLCPRDHYQPGLYRTPRGKRKKGNSLA